MDTPRLKVGSAAGQKLLQHGRQKKATGQDDNCWNAVNPVL